MVFAGVYYSPSILERVSWNRFARVLEERVHPVHMYLMHCRVALQIRISDRQQSYALCSGHQRSARTASISDIPPGNKLSKRAAAWPCQHNLHMKTSNALHRLMFLGRVSKKCSVVASSVSPTPTVPIFLAWRSYNATVINIGKFVNLRWFVSPEVWSCHYPKKRNLIINTLT
jgi:hypothetical protein